MSDKQNSSKQEVVTFLMCEGLDELERAKFPLQKFHNLATDLRECLNGLDILFRTK